MVDIGQAGIALRDDFGMERTQGDWRWFAPQPRSV
jgi:hypothetical protein